MVSLKTGQQHKHAVMPVEGFLPICWSETCQCSTRAGSGGGFTTLVSRRRAATHGTGKRPHREFTGDMGRARVVLKTTQIGFFLFFWVILACMCVKLQMRLYVCQAPCPFRVHFGSILGPFGSILGPFWVHVGSIFGSILFVV